MNTTMLFENQTWALVSKASGESCVADKSGDRDLLTYWQIKLKMKLHILTRLDRPVSGIVIFLKMNDQSEIPSLDEQLFHKVYLAAVRGKPAAEGKLEDWILHDKRSNLSRIANAKTPQAKKAVSELKILAVGENYTLCRIHLLTGRHHQIRCQMAARGTMIAGDTRYGAKRSLEGGRLGLHCIYAGLYDDPDVSAFLPPSEQIPWTIFDPKLFKDKNSLLDG